MKKKPKRRRHLPLLFGTLLFFAVVFSLTLNFTFLRDQLLANFPSFNPPSFNLPTITLPPSPAVGVWSSTGTGAGLQTCGNSSNPDPSNRPLCLLAYLNQPTIIDLRWHEPPAVQTVSLRLKGPAPSTAVVAQDSLASGIRQKLFTGIAVGTYQVELEVVAGTSGSTTTTTQTLTGLIMTPSFTATVPANASWVALTVQPQDISLFPQRGTQIVRIQDRATHRTIAGLILSFDGPTGPDLSGITAGSDSVNNTAFLHDAGTLVSPTQPFELLVSRTIYDNQLFLCPGKTSLGCSVTDSPHIVYHNDGGGWEVLSNPDSFNVTGVTVRATTSVWNIEGLTGTSAQSYAVGVVTPPDLDFSRDASVADPDVELTWSNVPHPVSGNPPDEITLTARSQEPSPHTPSPDGGDPVVGDDNVRYFSLNSAIYTFTLMLAYTTGLPSREIVEASIDVPVRTTSPGAVAGIPGSEALTLVLSTIPPGFDFDTDISIRGPNVTAGSLTNSALSGDRWHNDTISPGTYQIILSLPPDLTLDSDPLAPDTYDLAGVNTARVVVATGELKSVELEIVQAAVTSPPPTPPSSGGTNNNPPPPPPPANTPPTLSLSLNGRPVTSLASTGVIVGRPLRVTVSGTDTNVQDTLTLVPTTATTAAFTTLGITFVAPTPGVSPVSTTFTWTPTAAQTGDHDFIFEIKDAPAATPVPATLALEVIEIPQPTDDRTHHFILEANGYEVPSANISVVDVGSSTPNPVTRCGEDPATHAFIVCDFTRKADEILISINRASANLDPYLLSFAPLHIAHNDLFGIVELPFLPEQANFHRDYQRFIQGSTHVDSLREFVLFWNCVIANRPLCTPSP